MRTIARRAGLALGVSAAVLLAAGCDVVVGGLNARETATNTWSRSYPIAADGQLEIINGRGTVEIEGVEGTTIEVTAERKAVSTTVEGARELLQKLEIREVAGPRQVTLETKVPSMFGSHADVSYRVKVPRSVSVRARGTNGTIRIDGMSGAVWAEATNGTIDAANVSGSLEASTTNGSVRASVGEVAKGGIRLAATNGNVTLELPRAARAQLDVNTVNGGVRMSNLTLDPAAEQSRRRVRGLLNGGGPRIEIETTNGGIRLTGK